ncbi:MAG: hypothetical protein KAX87_08185 [Nitrospira sp.]|nr:hypothetical protein [Nitrospira sp.]
MRKPSSFDELSFHVSISCAPSATADAHNMPQAIDRRPRLITRDAQPWVAFLISPGNPEIAGMERGLFGLSVIENWIRGGF